MVRLYSSSKLRSPFYLIYDATRLKSSFTYTENRTRRQPFGRVVLKENLFKGCSCPPPCRITADPLNSRHISPSQYVLQGRLGVFHLLIRSGDRDLSLEATVTNDILSNLSLTFLVFFPIIENSPSLRDRNLIASHDMSSKSIYLIVNLRFIFNSILYLCDVMGTN